MKTDLKNPKAGAGRKHGRPAAAARRPRPQIVDTEGEWHEGRGPGCGAEEVKGAANPPASFGRALREREAGGASMAGDHGIGETVMNVVKMSCMEGATVKRRTGGTAKAKATATAKGVTAKKPAHADGNDSLISALGLVETLPPTAKNLTDDELNRVLNACRPFLEKKTLADIEAGLALLVITRTRAYKQEYSSFKAYCEQKWGIERSTAYELIRAAQVVLNVRNSGHSSRLPTNVAQALALAQIRCPQQQAKVWKAIVKRFPDVRITAKHVAEAVLKFQQKQAAAAPDEPDEVANELIERAAAAEPTGDATVSLRVVRGDDAADEVGSPVGDDSGSTLATRQPTLQQPAMVDLVRRNAVEFLRDYFQAEPKRAPTADRIPEASAMGAWVFLTDSSDDHAQRQADFDHRGPARVVAEGREIIVTIFWGLVQQGVVRRVGEGQTALYEWAEHGQAGTGIDGSGFNHCRTAVASCDTKE